MSATAAVIRLHFAATAPPFMLAIVVPDGEDPEKRLKICAQITAAALLGVGKAGQG